MLQKAFGDNAMRQSKTLLWYKRFKDGRKSADDDERSGRTSTSTTPENIAKVRELHIARDSSIIQISLTAVNITHTK
jgi:hypothetical protein